jgi:hypothetical protein
VIVALLYRKEVFNVAQNINRDDSINLYLLGELSEQEQEQIEREYFDDDDYFARLLSAEDELIERYLRAELSEDERSRFEKSIRGNLRRKRRIETYKALISPARQMRRPFKDQPSHLTWRELLITFLKGNGKIIPVALALLVLVILAGLWLYTKDNTSKHEVAVNRADQSGGNPDSSPRVVQNPPANLPDANRSGEENSQGNAPGRKTQQDNRQHDPANRRRPSPEQIPVVATFMLLPGTLRSGGELRTIEIRSDVTLVRLELGLLENDFSTYRVVLRQTGGRQIREWRGLKSQSGDSGTTIILSLPAKQINSGVFEFSLYGVTEGRGTQEVDDYQFRVVKIPS